MNNVEIIMWMLIPLLSFSCYKWGFQRGIEHTVEYMDKNDIVELDKDET